MHGETLKPHGMFKLQLHCNHPQ